MQELIVYKSPYQKLRVGNPNGDGGYIVVDLPTIENGTGQTYDHFISGGISNDISFEKHFLSLHPYIKCDAYDGTIPSLPEDVKNIKFYKENLNESTNIDKMINDYNNIFMKIDIEGHEYSFINEIIKRKLFHKIKQLVIEIHTPGDIKLHPTYFKGLDHITHKTMFQLFHCMNRTHKLVHFHPNNNPLLHTYNGTIIPNVFECTFIRVDDPKLKFVYNDEAIPSPLDRPNVSRCPDVRLSGYPYNTLIETSWFSFYK